MEIIVYLPNLCLINNSFIAFNMKQASRELLHKNNHMNSDSFSLFRKLLIEIPCLIAGNFH